MVHHLALFFGVLVVMEHLLLVDVVCLPLASPSLWVPGLGLWLLYHPVMLDQME